MKTNLFEEMEKEEEYQRHLKEYELIRKFAYLTSEEKQIVKQIIPNIQPNDYINFYQIFFDRKDLKIEEKIKGDYNVVNYLVTNNFVPPIGSFAPKFWKKEYEKWYNSDYLQNWQNAWKHYIRQQQEKYGVFFVGEYEMNYYKTLEFIQKVNEYVHKIREKRKPYDSIIKVDDFVAEISRKFNQYFKSLNKLSPLNYLDETYLNNEFQKFKKPLEDHIIELNFDPVLVPNIKNINEYEKIKRFKEKARKDLYDKEQTIMRKIQDFDNGKQRKMTKRAFLKRLIGKDIDFEKYDEFYFLTYTLGQWFDIYQKRTIREEQTHQQELISVEDLEEKEKTMITEKEKNKKGKEYGLEINKYEGTVKYPWKSKIRYWIKNHPYEETEERAPDYKIKIKKLSRPSFSEFPNCWEIDEVFNLIEHGDQYLFCLNVNTRYLVVFRLYDKKLSSFVDKFQELCQLFIVKSVRCDGDPRHVAAEEIFKNVNFFINTSKFTYHCKLVDSCVRTIRDAIGYRYLNEEQLQQIINYYNNTYHESTKMTPKKMQENINLEYEYIRKMKLKKDKAIINQRQANLRNYEPGNILMIHLFLGKTDLKFEKNRRRFNRLATFLKYEHGNVRCKLFNGTEILVPIFFTRFVSENKKNIPRRIISTFNLTTGKELELEEENENH